MAAMRWFYGYVPGFCGAARAEPGWITGILLFAISALRCGNIQKSTRNRQSNDSSCPIP